MHKKILNAYKRAILAVVATAVLAVGLLPLFNSNASAAQITSRSLTLSTAVISQTGVSYTFGFKLGTAGQVQGVKYEACTTALGSCTAPTGLTFASATMTSKSGFAGATNFTVDGTGGNDCTASASVLCIKRTDTTSEDTTTAKTLVFGTITNPSGASCASSNPNCTFFVKMTTYTTNTWTAGSIVDTGTVAGSTAQLLTIAASIQEVLNFCIGSTSVDDATTSPGSDCSAISGTTVNLGVLDSSTISTSPVASGSGGNAVNGVAMLKTNANSGATVSYRAIQQSGTNHAGSLRVVGASCNAGNVSTDQCINSAGTTQTTFTAGTEDFGMTIPGVNCGSTTAYTCTFSTGTYNLTRNAQYDGTGANTYGTTQGFAWREDGTIDQIASSTGAVDDEALVLKFAATPNIVTPTGSYQAQADFIVVATY
ncbi:MAG TPA: hypothetical protein VLE74_03120 [Candidatus Saccharimonadales bacterium]|nr:hypothetical protein [Candidatus Saccharimonadales bacterium]